MLTFGKPWHLPPAWGDIPTWITAIATVGLLAGAFVTAIYAIRAFSTQSQEVKDQAGMLQIQSEQLAEQRRINAQQIKVLDLQARELRESLDERKQEAEQRKSAQAARVFISQKDQPASSKAWAKMWQEGDSKPTYPEPDHILASAVAVNASDSPIYDAELRWHRGSASHGDPNPELLGTIMPGSEAESTRDFPLDTNMAVSGAVLRFRDAAGVRWIRRPDGGLVEQP